MFNINPEEAKERFSSLVYQGKKLVPDIFGRATFVYVAEVQSDQTVKLSGLLQINKREYQLEEVDCFFEGPPPGFIKGIFLYFIGSDVRYRELKALPRVTDIDELRELQSEEVEVIVLGEELIKARQPKLILKDRLGITATLDHADDEKELKLTAYQKRNYEWICPSDKVLDGLSLLHAGGWKIENREGQEIVPYEAMDLDWQEEGLGFTLTGKVRFHENEVAIEAIKKERLIPLGNGKLGLLPHNFKLFNLQTLHFKREKLGELIDFVGESFYEKLAQKKEVRLIAVKEASPSLEFKGILRPYQQEGLNWLNFLYHNHYAGLLADDMGLGKTVQTLALVSLLPIGKPILVVLPTSLKFNWLAEIRKFLPSREKDFTLVSYTGLRLGIDDYKEIEWEAVILDEAQAIKNRDTLSFKAVSSLKSRFRLSMTGTPVENRLSEMVTHFKFLLPDLELTDEPWQLKKLTAPFMMRRKKESVLKDLPEKVEENVYIEMLADQKQVYERFLMEAQKGDLEHKTSLEILEVILRLRQIACHPMLAGIESTSSAKMEAVMSDIETLVEEGRKVIVFSQFTSFLGLLGRELKEKGLDYLYLDGQTVKREEVVNEFQENDEKKLFLMSLKAGGVGLNLTAADTILLLDPWWNQAVEEQAVARAHRIGQKRSVLVKRYITVDSVEEKIEKLKASKQNLADELVNETSTSVKDLIDLLE